MINSGLAAALTAFALALGFFLARAFAGRVGL